MITYYLFYSCENNLFQADQRFSVQLDKEKAEDIASRLIEESKMLESNKDLFIEQLNTIITRVSFLLVSIN